MKDGKMNSVEKAMKKFLKLIKIGKKRDYIIEENENEIIMSCCDGRMIRSLSKKIKNLV